MKKKTIVFIIFLLISSLIVAAAGMAVRHFLLIPLGIDREEHPIALPFVLMADEILQAQVEVELEALRNPPTEPPVTEPLIPETVPPATQVPPQPPTEPPTEAPTEAPTEPPTEPGPVDEGWFDDALFIGESRIQGLQVFSRLGDADYFCAASMTVYGVLDAKLSDTDFTDTTLDQLLQSREYGKVYIHLGINEIPVGSTGIYNGYMKIVERVRALEPDATIVLMGCMAITEQYAARMGFDMNTVHALNDKLKALAESEPEVFRFSDTNSWAAGEDGYLIPEITHDGCHLHAERYADWCAQLKEEAAGYNIP